MEASTRENHASLADTEIHAMIANALHTDSLEIDVGQPLVKCGMTSIELIDLITRIERHYGILFQPAIMKDLTTRGLVEAVRQLVNKRPR
jgi:acyl carrier protein